MLIPLKTFFDQSNTPVTGLTPTVRTLDLSGNYLVHDAACTEVGDGLYVYWFDLKNIDTHFVWRIDGGASMTSGRYSYGACSEIPEILSARHGSGEWEWRKQYVPTTAEIWGYTIDGEKASQMLKRASNHKDIIQTISEVKDQFKMIEELEKVMEDADKKSEERNSSLLSEISSSISSLKKDMKALDGKIPKLEEIIS